MMAINKNTVADSKENVLTNTWASHVAAFVLSKFRKKKEDGIVEEGLEFADDSYINEDEENAEDQQK